MLEPFGDLLQRRVGEQPGDRQRELAATSPSRATTSPPPSACARSAHSAMSASSTPTTTRLCASWATVEANAPARSPNPRTSPSPTRPVAVVALDHRDLGQVARRVGDHVAVLDPRLRLARAGDQLARVDVDHAHPLRRAGDAERDRDRAHRVAQRRRARAAGIRRLAAVLEHGRDTRRTRRSSSRTTSAT